MGELQDWAAPIRAMYEASPVATLILDSELTLQWKNQAAEHCDYAVLPQQEGDGLNLAGPVNLRARLEAGVPFTLTIPSVLQGPVEWVFLPQMDASGRLQGVLAHLFAQAGVQSHPTQSWKESLSNPVSIFNNQFRTPLSQIFSVLGLLRTDYQQDPALSQHLQRINWCCFRMLRTVINFSTDSKILEGRLQPNLLVADLCRLVRLLCQDVAGMLEQGGYSFSYDVPEEPFRTLCDWDLLSCAICNLLSNACKFTPPEHSHISLKMEAFEKQVTIVVTDNGFGMQPATLEQAFDRFYSFDPETGAPCGDGLGLYISRMILQLHRGTIALQSKPGEGTTAALTIPVAQPQQDAAFYDIPFGSDPFSNPMVILSDAISPDL